MTLELSKALQILERTPSAVGAMLGGTGAGLHAANEGPGTWSPYDVVGHLIYADERVWLVRARLIVERDDLPEFSPGDPAAQFTLFAGWPLDRLLEQFATTRAASLAQLERWSLTAASLSRRGRHTVFGAVTLGELIATWAVHDLTHLSQIARVLARSFEAEVGAWHDSLSILDR